MVSRFNDKIVVYEDIFPQDAHVFVNGRRNSKGLRDPVPENPRNLIGTVKAYVNHGRWIAECPGGCTDAVLASSEYPVFVCSMPHCEEKNYLRIVFPTNRSNLETELLKRSLHPSGGKTHANWHVGETVADLRKERLANEAL